MTTSLHKLLALADAQLAEEPPCLPSELLAYAPRLGEQLRALLHQKNGFFAFEGALHLFPAATVDPTKAGYDLVSWNSVDLWRSEYEQAGQDFLFFAEDVFGEQFALKGDSIYRFNPETAQAEEIATDLEEWADRLLANFNFETGYSLMHQWRQQQAPLLPTQRLVPAILFALGGAYSVENLHALDAVEGMGFRAEIWRQCRNLPPGTQVRLVIRHPSQSS
jgi:hypothetical protein